MEIFWIICGLLAAGHYNYALHIEYGRLRYPFLNKSRAITGVMIFAGPVSLIVSFIIVCCMGWNYLGWKMPFTREK